MLRLAVAIAAAEEAEKAEAKAGSTSLDLFTHSGATDAMLMTVGNGEVRDGKGGGKGSPPNMRGEVVKFPRKRKRRAEAADRRSFRGGEDIGPSGEGGGGGGRR